MPPCVVDPLDSWAEASSSGSLARLKSSSIGTPSGVIKMFEGLRSLCRTPWSWACCRASESRAHHQATNWAKPSRSSVCLPRNWDDKPPRPSPCESPSSVRSTSLPPLAVENESSLSK